MEVAAIVFASVLPVVAAIGVVLLLRRMRLAHRLLIALGAVIVTTPLALILLLEMAVAFSPAGRPGPGAGIIAVPLISLSVLALVICVAARIGLEFADNLQRRVSAVRRDR